MLVKYLRFLWVVGLSSLLVSCSPGGGVVGGSITPGGGGGSGSPGEDTSCVTPINGEELGREILLRVNAIRRQYLLNELTWSDHLAQIAGDYACRMIRGGFFAHIDPDTGEGPGERAYKAGYFFLGLGENLAGGQPTPEAAVDAWMDSQSHRENILNPDWVELGVGVREGGEFGIYWVQEFGDPP